MKRFAALFHALDATTRTDAKVAALVDWMGQVQAADAAWGVYLLAGGRPRRTIPTAVMRAEAQAVAGLSDWLFEASYAAVGDLAETIAKVLPPPTHDDDLGLADWMTERLVPLRGQPPKVQAEALRQWWAGLDDDGRFLLIKLIGGGFRVGVSRGLVQRAIARHAGLDARLVAQRMMGFTDGNRPPTPAAWAALIAPAGADEPARDGRPFPFYLAHPLPAGWGPTASGSAPATGPATDPAQVRRAAPALDAGRKAEPEGVSGPDAGSDLGPDPDHAVAAHGHPDPGPDLGPVTDWLAEWKYDGIRAQLVRRASTTWIWSRGEELMTGRFPEVEALAAGLPDGTMLDGELLVWPDGAGRPGAFQTLQTRIQRKTVGRKALAEAPVVFMAYDLLALDGQDWRERPLAERRAALERLLADGPLRLSPRVPATRWTDLAEQRLTARERGMEGLMLKHWRAPYGVGRSKPAGLAAGGWWKWKLDPLEVDGVLIYAQAGHGRRAGLYTDYTFAAWNRPPRDAAEAAAVVEAIARREPPDPEGLQLVAFTKAYSGLTDEEFRRVDQHIRRHALERFGPVRSVRPALVISLGFEGVQRSPRHKSGLALRFPRMLRLRPDLPLHEADDLSTLRQWLPPLP